MSTNYESLLTVLHSKAASASSVLATATAREIVVSNSKAINYATASIDLVSNQQILATATASQVIQSASAAVAVATASIEEFIQADNLYGMTPNYGANLTMVIAFAVFLLLHTTLGLFTRQWWFGTAFFCGAGLEMAGYIGRFLSHSNVDELNDFLVQIICLTIAPCFIMGGIYYLLSQFIVVYGTSYALIKPMYYSYIFIACDIVSLVIQAAGGGIAATNLTDDLSPDSGTHVMVAGLAFQVFSMSIYIFFFLHYFYKIQYLAYFSKSHQQHPLEPTFNSQFVALRSRPLFKYYPIVIFITVMFVYVRCIYRVIELAEGWSGFLITHEVYFMILDALMMGLTCLVLIPFHPGLIFGKSNINVAKRTKDIEDKFESFEDFEEEKMDRGTKKFSVNWNLGVNKLFKKSSEIKN